jgi:hypothetical protein
VEALVKDTAFEALIIGAADGLDKRVQERKSLAKKMTDPEMTAALGSQHGGAVAELAELAKHVERDAERQANVAKWLRTLVGGRGRDALAAGSESKANEQGGG